MNPEYEPHWTNYLKQFDLPASHFTDIPTATDKFCVIVEPRKHPLLPLVIKNFMYLLKKRGWGLIIFHGTENDDYIREGLAGWIPDSYKMIGLGVANLTIADYNARLTSPTFWGTLQSMGCKHALIFQTDALLLNDNVDDFLKWDYVGAPWKQPEFRWFGCLEIGNGGFSLRNVDSMYRIVAVQKFQLNGNEDCYFSMACLKLGYNVPTIAQASAFSVETIFHPAPCGLHKPPYLSIFPAGEYERMLAVRHV